MNLEANIFPVFDAEADSHPDLDSYLASISRMEKALLKTPLHQNPVVSLAKAEFDNEAGSSTNVVDNYEFLITRRFMFYGEWHVGGANGEVLNVHTFISGFRAFWESQLGHSK